MRRAPAPGKTAAAPQAAATPKVQVVKAEEQVQAPAAPKAAQASTPAPKQKVAGTPTLVAPSGATPAKAKPAPATQVPGAPIDLLRTDTD